MAYETLILPAKCDRQAADNLLPDLRVAVAAGDVVVDGRAVVQFGQAMLQLLLSARKTSVTHRSVLTVSASDAMCATLALARAEHLLDHGTGR